MPESRPHTAGCPAECPGCAVGRAEQISAAGPFAGRTLVLAATLTFLLPLICSVLGTWFAGGSPSSQLVGGLAGLVMGMLMARGWVLVGTMRGGRRP